MAAVGRVGPSARAGRQPGRADVLTGIWQRTVKILVVGAKPPEDGGQMLRASRTLRPAAQLARTRDRDTDQEGDACGHRQQITHARRREPNQAAAIGGSGDRRRRSLPSDVAEHLFW